MLCLVSCRDEQAGPRQRPPPRAQTPTAAQGRVLDQAPPGLTGAAGTLGGGVIQYLGSRASSLRAKQGTQITVGHYFRAVSQPPQGWKFFAHVVDDASGQLLVNADHEFQEGAMPMGSWPVGKVVEDVHSFTLPPAPSGRARVLVGFWQEQGRFPVDNANAHRGDLRLLGPVIELQIDELPTYIAKRAARAPVIDGDLNDAAWAAATKVELTHSFDGRKTQLRTTARLTWDDEHLYVGFDSEDPDVWGTLMKRDDPIYNEECVEVFIDANGDGRTYNELQVSPNNVVFDAYFVSYRSDLEVAKQWDSQVQTAVKVRGTVNNPNDTDEGWTAEMKIPIARLADVPNVPPKPGDRWRFNVYRLEHLQRRSVEGSSFSPLFRGDFHALPRFGWLQFDN